MTSDIQTGLRVIVERAVRPVLASASRKRALREELLAHVSAVFEEESARPGGEQAALARAAERFGDPAAVAAELEASVPWMDSVERIVDGLWFNAGESTLLRAGRLTLLCEAFSLLVVWLFFDPAKPWRLETLAPLGMALLMIGVLALSIGLLTSAIREVLVSWSSSAWLASAAIVVAASSALYGLLWMLDAASDPLAALAGVACLMACVVSAASVLAHLFDARIREHEEWASLELT